jgi:competence protein ComEA
MSNKRNGIIYLISLIFIVGFVFSESAGGQTKAPTKAPAKASSLVRFDVNKATAEQLSKCPGLTSALAKAIAEFREKSGPFKSSEDLLKVKGMTKELLNKLNPKIDRDILYLMPAAPSAGDDEEEPSLKPSKC